MARVDGKVVSVGDIVCFKSDCEQSGRITKVSGDILTLECKTGFVGAYIGGNITTTVHVADCWLEG